VERSGERAIQVEDCADCAGGRFWYSGTVTSADWGGGLLSTGDETDVAQRMEQAIRRYYAACNSGDVEAVAAFSPPALCITSRQATAARPRADELSVR